MFDLNKIIKEIKSESNPDNLGMILVHNGVVRATSKSKEKVKGMSVDYSEQAILKLKEWAEKHEFVEKCTIWINRGKLNIGDDIMYVVLAGTDRKKLIPLFEEIIEKLKTEVVREKEEK